MSSVAGDVQIRAMTVADASAIVSLNQSVVSVTSQMDKKSFGRLLDLSMFSSVAVRDGECVGFVFAIDHSREYENDNYRWFSSRLDNFVYVDRVVVSGTCRGMGVGSLLYFHLFAATRRAGAQCITAEIDIEPPNQPSLRFHEKTGFVEIGTRELTSGKRVSLQVCQLGNG